MNHLFRRCRGFAAIGALLFATPGIAGLQEGLDDLRKGDYAAAAKELRPLAEHGDAEAQYRIGRMYQYGAGYPTDKAQAVAWYKKAAAQNHTAAPQDLGVMYATGDGVPKDEAQAVQWFRKAAELGNLVAQYNLGLMYAKGAGIKKDDTRAVEWFRKAAAQGEIDAQVKLGVAYENGQGVPKNVLLAYTSYAIAARNGAKEAAGYRDDIAKELTPAQARDALATADAWTVGQPMPTSVAAAGAAPAAATASSAPHVDKCSASGTMGGEKFSATHCAVSFFSDAHSVAIWFNEDPITPDETAGFQTSSYAGGDKGGKPRTMLIAMFCPGGGAAAASASAVTSIDLNTNHAKSPLAGVQWVVEAPKDFKVEKLAGDLKPGGVLTGHIVGSRDKTSWNLDFDVALPAKDAAAGMSCEK